MTLVEVVDEQTVHRLSSAKEGGGVLRRLAGDKAALLGVTLLLLLLLVALMAPWVATHDPIQTDFQNRLAGPTARHLLGTDQVGRDEFSRIVFGARLSVGMAATATLGISLVGIMLGLAAGVYGGGVDGVVMRVVDVLQALPTLILAVVVVGLLGGGAHKMVLTIVALGWPGYARVVRGVTLSLRERGFVDAARAVGASRLRIMVRHLLPNLLGPMIVLSTLSMGRTLLAVSGLSFLGFGVQLPTPEWGAMLAEGRNYIDSAPRLLAFPGAAITLLVLACNLAGDGLRDLLDHRLVRPR